MKQYEKTLQDSINYNRFFNGCVIVQVTRQCHLLNNENSTLEYRCERCYNMKNYFDPEVV